MHTTKTTITVDWEEDTPLKALITMESADEKENGLTKYTLAQSAYLIMSSLSSGLASVMLVGKNTNPNFNIEEMLKSFCDLVREDVANIIATEHADVGKESGNKK